MGGGAAPDDVDSGGVAGDAIAGRRVRPADHQARRAADEDFVLRPGPLGQYGGAAVDIRADVIPLNDVARARIDLDVCATPGNEVTRPGDRAADRAVRRLQLDAIAPTALRRGAQRGGAGGIRADEVPL